jgi:hypothetical protein
MIRQRIWFKFSSLLLVTAVFQPHLASGQEASPAQEKAVPAAEAGEPRKDEDKQAEAAGKVNGQAAGQPAPEDLIMPKPVPEEKLVPVLRTVPVRKDRPSFNDNMVNTTLTPRDREDVWVLDFSFKPLRIRTVDIPGKGRRPVYYLSYKVVNHTGKPRMFCPQFIMVNEEGKRFEDEVIPEAIPIIRARQDQTIPLLGAVSVMGIIPQSTKEGVDDAVFGVAVWEKWDPKSDRFSVYVRGLSDGYKEVPNPKGGKPIVKYKTLRIDFIRRGDERNISENEIELNDPSYEWVYW